jgi:hypothetical protein
MKKLRMKEGNRRDDNNNDCLHPFYSTTHFKRGINATSSTRHLYASYDWGQITALSESSLFLVFLKRFKSFYRAFPYVYSDKQRLYLGFTNELTRKRRQLSR